MTHVGPGARGGVEGERGVRLAGNAGRAGSERGQDPSLMLRMTSRQKPHKRTYSVVMVRVRRGMPNHDEMTVRLCPAFTRTGRGRLRRPERLTAGSVFAPKRTFTLFRPRRNGSSRVLIVSDP